MTGFAYRILQRQIIHAPRVESMLLLQIQQECLSLQRLDLMPHYPDMEKQNLSLIQPS